MEGGKWREGGKDRGKGVEVKPIRWREKKRRRGKKEGRRDPSCCGGSILNLCTLTPDPRTNRRGTQYLVKWRELPYDQATWEYLGEDCGLRGAAAAVEQYEQLRYFSQGRGVLYLVKGYGGSCDLMWSHVVSCDFTWSSPSPKRSVGR